MMGNASQRLHDVGPVSGALALVGVWLLGATAYCYFHGVVGAPAEPDLAASAAWALRIWGVWLLLGPLLWAWWRRPATSPMGAALRGLAALVVALAAMLGLGALAGSTLPPAQRLYLYVPQAAALLALLAISAFIRNLLGGVPDRTQPPVQRLSVDVDGTTALVNPDEVRWVGAQGNYVELSDGVRRGRMRSTLSELQQQLPEASFQRVHRSFLVNLHFVEEIERLPGSRSARIRLRGDERTIPASREGVAALRNRIAE